MGLESVTHISDLNVANPTTSDGLSQGDDHIRNLKTALKTDFPNINGVVSASDEDLSACENFEETISATTSEVSIATGKTLNIVDDSAGLKIGGTVIAASAADLNATTNFEEVISATTSEASISTGKTLNIADDGGLKIAGTAITATAAEINICDAPNGANKALKLNANAVIPFANMLVDDFSGSVASVATASWSGAQTLALTNITTVWGAVVMAKHGAAFSFVDALVYDENGYAYRTGATALPAVSTVTAGTVKLYLYNSAATTQILDYRVFIWGK